MFEINKSSYNEILENLEINLKKVASDQLTINDKKLIEAIELLNVSAETLENFGFNKEAELLTKLTVLTAQSDPHTANLTYEKMVENLKNKGIMFDVNDGNEAKDHKSHEGPDEYKREKLEEEYIEEMLENDYDKILGDLDEEADEVII